MFADWFNIFEKQITLTNNYGQSVSSRNTDLINYWYNNHKITFQSKYQLSLLFAVHLVVPTLWSLLNSVLMLMCFFILNIYLLDGVLAL